MKDALEEFGSTLVVGIAASIAFVALAVLIKKSGLLATFAEMYSEYFYGTC